MRIKSHIYIYICLSRGNYTVFYSAYCDTQLQVLFSSHHLGRITKGRSNNYNSESLTLYLHLLTLHNCTVI